MHLASVEFSSGLSPPACAAARRVFGAPPAETRASRQNGVGLPLPEAACQRGGGDGHADDGHRGGEKQRGAGVSHGSGVFGLSEQWHVQQADRFDREHRDQSHGVSGRHGDDVFERGSGDQRGGPAPAYAAADPGEPGEPRPALPRCPAPRT